MNKAPDWVKNLTQGDTLIVIFPYTGHSLLCEVVYNNPTLENSLYFGTIAVKYTYKDRVNEEDLLYDNYSVESEYIENWYAQPVI
jgi:hypothetical protein